MFVAILSGAYSAVIYVSCKQESQSLCSEMAVDVYHPCRLTEYFCIYVNVLRTLFENYPVLRKRSMAMQQDTIKQILAHKCQPIRQYVTRTEHVIMLLKFGF